MTSLTFGGGYGNARNATAVWRGWDRFDYVMVVAAGALVIYGLLLIYSGSLPWYEGPIVSLNNPAAKQAIFAAVGIVGMLIVSKIDYHYFIHYSWAFYIMGILSLVAILLFGTTEGGAKSWFTFGPVQLQPSEFAKIATILLLARFFSEHGGDARELKSLVLSIAIMVPVVGLIFIQPDLGTSLVFGAIWLGIVIVAGVNRSHLLVMGGAFIAILPFVWTFAIADYQVQRISVLVDPERDPLGQGFTTRQGEIALGSGQVFGKGFTNGDQTQLEYLRVATRDFIFSLMGEEFGFVGAMVMFALFILLLMRGIRAAQLAGDTAGQLVAVGIVMLILMQTFINIAVNVRFFPVTGIPLPFVSQGGPSLISLFGAIGLLQSIVMRHRAYRQT